MSAVPATADGGPPGVGGSENPVRSSPQPHGSARRDFFWTRNFEGRQRRGKENNSGLQRSGKPQKSTADNFFQMWPLSGKKIGGLWKIIRRVVAPA